MAIYSKAARINAELTQIEASTAKEDVQMILSPKAARINAELTQIEASAALEISKNTLCSYEKYRTVPDVETAKRMADLYGVTLDSIKWSKS